MVISHGCAAGCGVGELVSLAFWFAVLREDADLIEGGQGTAVQRRVRERWQAYLGRVFDQAAREHAVHLVSSGQLPAEMTVGRWWREEVAEIDVLGLLRDRPRLVGEARWQTTPLTERDVRALTGKITYLPEPDPELELAFWSRGGAPSELVRQRDVTVFTPADMV